MPLVLRAPSPFDSARKLDLHRCPACATLHYPEVETPSYDIAWGGAEATEVRRGPMKFYVEQGAGPDVIVAPLFRVDPATVRSYVEVGCGFGFSLDFASRVFGWTARGYDPSDIASSGRALLGVDIRSMLLTPESAAGEPLADFLLASEVIEHVPEPDGFLADISAAIAPEGLLAVATPDGERVAPDLSRGILLPILTPGFHLVLFSAEGLRRALLRAGFPHVEVHREGNSIRGYASRQPLRLRADEGVDRELYLRYLLERWLSVPPDSALAHGFAARLFKEFVNKGDYAAAMKVFSPLVDSLERVYELDLARPRQLVVEVAEDFESFARQMPMTLAGVAYRRGLIALNRGEAAELAGDWFDLAVRAGEALRAALNRFGADDGETEEVVARARIYALFALAGADPDAAAEAALPLADGGNSPLTLPMREELLAGLLLRLVNQGAFAAAGRIAAAVEPQLAAAASASRAAAEGCYALGLLRQQEGDAAAALTHLRAAARKARAGGDEALAWRAMGASARAACALGDTGEAATVGVEHLAAAFLEGGPIPREESGTALSDLLLRLLGQGATGDAERLFGQLRPRLHDLPAPGLYAAGLIALNVEQRPQAACGLFDMAAGLADEKGLRWRSRANGLLASVVAGDAEAALRRLAQIDRERGEGEIPVTDANRLVRELRDRFTVPAGEASR